MCNLQYHHCPECNEEYDCDRPDRDCELNKGYNDRCGKCEHWIDEQRREMDREEKMKWERQQWEQEHNFRDD